MATSTGSYRRTGTLWEGRFKSCLVDSEHYVLACYRYIELNPVRAGMVTEPASEERLMEIRAYVHQQKALGSSRFQAQIEAALGRQVQVRAAHRPRRQGEEKLAK